MKQDSTSADEMPPEWMDRYKRSYVRILRADPCEVVGGGFLVDNAHVVTCAHVVAQVLYNATEGAAPTRKELIVIDFPFTDLPFLSAYVVTWLPYKYDPHRGEIGDIAVLAFTDESIAKFSSIDTTTRPEPANVVKCNWLKDHLFGVFGYPKGYNEDGAFSYGTIQDQKPNGRYQTGGTPVATGVKVQPGFSGAPVLDDDKKGVVGIVVQSAVEDNTATIIPIDMIEAALDSINAASPASVSESTSKIPVGYCADAGARDVFISYSPKDQIVAKTVCDTLESAGLPCWIACRDVVAGRSLDSEVVLGLQESEIVVFIWSSSSILSDNCVKEITIASDRYHKPVLPFRIEKIELDDKSEQGRILISLLAATKRLDALTRPLDVGLTHLVQAVHNFVKATKDLKSEQEEQAKLQLVSDVTPAVESNQALDIQMKQVSKPETESLLAKADTLANDGEFDEAVSLYDQILKKEPQNTPVLAKKGQALAKEGHTDQALHCFTEAVSRYEHSEPPPIDPMQVTAQQLKQQQETKKEEKSAVEQVMAMEEQLSKQQRNALKIQTEMMSDNQKQQMERWKILQDTQTKIFEIQQDMTANRAKTQQKAFSNWDRYIRS